MPRKGAVWHAATEEQLRITSGEAELGLCGEHWEEAAKALLAGRPGRS